MHPTTQTVKCQLRTFGQRPFHLTPSLVVPKVKRESKPSARVYWPGPYRDSSHAYRAKDVDA